MHLKTVKKLSGEVTIAGDKSISHRALILSSMAIGTTYIHGLLEAEDVLNTAKALQAMGVPMNRSNEGVWKVNGVGIGGLSEPTQILNMENSGTGTRLLMGLVAPYPFNTFFCGDESLTKRPMNRIISPLKEMGIECISRSNGRLPLAVLGKDDLLPIEYRLPIPSAQVKSAVLLAGLNTAGITTVIEGDKTRDHTEIMMADLGFPINVEEISDGRRISIEGQQEVHVTNKEICVPGDPSSAAFLIAAGLIVEGSNITIKNVCLNDTRTGLIDTLIEMGADITFDNRRKQAGEKVADIIVKHSKLKGVTVPAERAPSMIDEFPILAVIASFAEGTTTMQGLDELRVKECDRLQVTYDGLCNCGVKATIGENSLSVEGGTVKGGATVSTHMDHRIAMSFLIMGLSAQDVVFVDDIASINTSFPEFFNQCKALGIEVSE